MESTKLVVLLAVLFAGCGPGLVAAEQLDIDVEVRLEQEEPVSGEGYVVTYRHRADHTTSDLARESKVMNASWSSYETCLEPPHRIEWESSIDFDEAGFDHSDFHVVVRDGQIWLLYDPALEFGIEHVGRPPCDSADGVAAGTTVGKRFFSGDLEEPPSSAGELPVYLWVEELAVGGFVLVAVPLDGISASEGVPIAVDRSMEDGDFKIALRVQGTMRAGG